jgi:response regulator RpfG family c-di-GMP phosphodiesterase
MMQETYKHTILAVDDEEGILKALVRLFKSIDIELSTATSGAEALKMLQASQYSLIISDQRMPGMTGVEFLHLSRDISPDSIRVLLTGYADINATVEAINSGAVRYYFNKPWDDNIFLSRIEESLKLYELTLNNKELLALTRQQNEQLKIFNTTLEDRVASQTREIKINRNAILKSFMQTIKALSTMVDLRFKDIGSHSQRIAAFAKQMLKGYTLGQKEYQDIIVAAFLHDIGKIGLPDKIVNKHSGEITKMDEEEIRKHSILGQSCVFSIDGFEEIGTIIRHHHENYDGSGYPDAIREYNIPLGSRIIRIADAFDKMAFSKGYPSVRSINDASAHLVQYTESYFDPTLVKKIIELDIAKGFLYGEKAESYVSKVFDLEPGMIVAADIHTGTGMFLLPKGAKLSSGMIKRIMKIDKADPIHVGVQVFAAADCPKEGAYGPVQSIAR